ncbi:DUF2524 family protein [Gracilibacillus alcaliphilus]|uniref:DUF2524 family protein n=1 Tax=Gracilibacillus alcaliphilus TaxID=1401441 RepID=UPI00195B77E2|nr:DUF2524 family protein [Gracilibacillus alcaliphilus]MBM7675846.1 exonuclease VII small subunit [Gracilibacillus alcaliphilus]
MTTRESIEELLTKGQQILEQVDQQLEQSNRNDFEMNQEYTEAHMELEAFSQKLNRVMQSANPQQLEQLQRFQFIVQTKLNDLILDRVDIDQYQ